MPPKPKSFCVTRDALAVKYNHAEKVWMARRTRGNTRGVSRGGGMTYWKSSNCLEALRQTVNADIEHQVFQLEVSMLSNTAGSMQILTAVHCLLQDAFRLPLPDRAFAGLAVDGEPLRWPRDSLLGRWAPVAMALQGPVSTAVVAAAA